MLIHSLTHSVSERVAVSPMRPDRVHSDGSMAPKQHRKHIQSLQYLTSFATMSTSDTSISELSPHLTVWPIGSRRSLKKIYGSSQADGPLHETETATVTVTATAGHCHCHMPGIKFGFEPSSVAVAKSWHWPIAVTMFKQLNWLFQIAPQFLCESRTFFFATAAFSHTKHLNGPIES
jgi:hypothetical protein